MPIIYRFEHFRNIYHLFDGKINFCEFRGMCNFLHTILFDLEINLVKY